MLKQVEQLLAEGRAVGNRELREYLEVPGYADAARWVYGQAVGAGQWPTKSLVTLSEVRPHLAASERESPGSFREHDIAPFPGGMTPPPWPQVPGDMDTWVRRLKRIVRAPQRLEALAEAHAEFERIHPFLDGNGRTGRLVLNLMLVRLGYSPVIIHKRDRERHLAALRSADRGEPGPFGELVARAACDNVYRFLMPALAGPSRLVPLAALATDDLNEGALRVAAIRGRLRAQKGPDGRWRSTKAWVREYQQSRQRRRRKKQSAPSPRG